MTDDIEYTTLDSTDPAGIRKGDRVTLTNEETTGFYPATSVVSNVYADGTFALAGWVHTPSTAIIHKIERPVPRVVEEVGVVYGSPTDPTARVMCMAAVDEGGMSWLATRPASSAIKPSIPPGHAWVGTSKVQRLITDHGFVRVDVQPEGGEQS